MKSVIVYVSTHHGNTKKVVDAISNELDVDVVDALNVDEISLESYDLICFASGIYGAKMHPKIIKFAEQNLPVGKKIAFIMTSALNKDFSKSMSGALEEKMQKWSACTLATGTTLLDLLSWSVEPAKVIRTRQTYELR